MRQVRSQNPELLKLIRFLRKKSKENDVAIWREVADRLSASRRMRTSANLSRLNRYTEEKEVVVIPGKVLGAGKLEHPLVVAAFAFSDEARQKITQAKGKCLTISELAESTPRGSNVRIME